VRKGEGVWKNVQWVKTNSNLKPAQVSAFPLYHQVLPQTAHGTVSNGRINVDELEQNVIV